MTTETAGAILGAIDTLRFLECNEDATDLQDAYGQLISEGTVALPVADYGVLPVIPHPLDTLAAVAQFMHVAGQEVKASPGQPTPEVLKLRLNLELEELYEKAQAFGLEGTFQQMLLNKVPTESEEGANDGIVYLPRPIDDTLIYDAVEVLDACVDQCYVQNGTVLACGLQAAFVDAFAEVQKSNMSKFCSSRAAAELEADNYAAQKEVLVKVRERNGLFVLCRQPDNKVLKPSSYMPANLGPILKKHGGQ